MPTSVKFFDSVENGRAALLPAELAGTEGAASAAARFRRWKMYVNENVNGAGEAMKTSTRCSPVCGRWEGVRVSDREEETPAREDRGRGVRESGWPLGHHPGKHVKTGSLNARGPPPAILFSLPVVIWNIYAREFGYDTQRNFRR